MKTPLCTMSKSETTSASNCKVIRDGEAGRRGARWHWQVTFTLDFQFLALKGLIKLELLQVITFFVSLSGSSMIGSCKFDLWTVYNHPGHFFTKRWVEIQCENTFEGRGYVLISFAIFQQVEINYLVE